jgi:hypothetical protein
MGNKQCWVIAWIVVTLIQLCYILYATYSPLYFPILNAPYTQIASIVIGIFATLLVFKTENKTIERRINVSWGVLIIMVGLITSVALTMCKIYMWCLIWVVAGVKILR